MKVSFEDLQQALGDERITMKQFVSVLIDNYGFVRTTEILKHNMFNGNIDFFEF